MSSAKLIPSLFKRKKYTLLFWVLFSCVCLFIFREIHALFLHQELHPLDDNHFLTGSTIAVLLAGSFSYLFFQNRILRQALHEKEILNQNVHESHMRFSLIAENMEDMVHLNSSDGKILYANPATTRLLGYELSEIINTQAFDLIHPHYRDSIKGDMEKVIRGETLRPARIELIKKDSTTLEVEVKGFAVRNKGEIKYLGAVLRDVSWQNSIQDWQNTFDSISDFISVHDENYTILKANRALCDYLGLSLQEVIGKKCFEIFHTSDTPIKECPHAKTLKQGKPSSLRITIDDDQGALLVYCSPYFTKAGSLAGTVHTVRPVSADSLTSLEDQAQKIKEQEEQIQVDLGIQPICSFCKKMRTHDGKWQSVETFIEQRLDILCSHSFCETCAKENYPDFF